MSARAGGSLATAAEPAPAPADRGRGWHGRPPGWAPPNKDRTYPPEVLAPDEVYALLTACGIDACGKRNRAMIMVGWRAGLRVSEVLALRPKDVDREHGRIQVLHGKGDKRRVVAIDPGAQEVIEQWMTERQRLGFDGSHPLFCAVHGPTKGGPLRSCQVRGLMAQLREKARIEKRVHFHGLRHTYAAYLMDQGVPIHYIKTMLGHSSLVMTQHYCDRVNPAKVLDAMRTLEWPVPAAAPGDAPTAAPSATAATAQSPADERIRNGLYDVRWD